MRVGHYQTSILKARYESNGLFLFCDISESMHAKCVSADGSVAHVTSKAHVTIYYYQASFLSPCLLTRAFFVYSSANYKRANNINMNWQPTLSWENAKLRSNVIAKIRSFFHARDVVEVETPILANATITDVYLDPFVTQFNYSSDSELSQSTPLYAQTSPEFAMKRLLASGYGCCYQICKAFRHEEHGRYHNPEFTMLEWYRIGFDHFQLMDEVAKLLTWVLGCDEADKISYQQLFLQQVSIDPLMTTKSELLEFITKRGVYSDWLAEETTDTLLQFIMSELIEPDIGINVPCFVYDFPATQASLARISEGDNRVAERFECYYRGIELANGFNELTDARQQLARFEQDNETRIAQGKEGRIIDENFIAALDHGLPECAGVALGVDRLLMLALNAELIDEVISFPIASA